MGTMSRKDATKEVLGTLQLKEVGRIVDRLLTPTNTPANDKDQG